MPSTLRSRLQRSAAQVRARRGRTSAAEFFDALAPVYDDWWRDQGRFEPGSRPGWTQEVEQILRILHSLQPARTLDVGCGTGFLTGELPGPVVGVDISERMLDVARRQVPHVEFIKGDATELPFPDASFDRVFACGLCTHLEPAPRAQFLAQARRVAHELVIVNGAIAVLEDEPGDPPRVVHGEAERFQTRLAPDGSRYRLYKRWVTAERLCRDLGGGEILHDGHYFVMARTPSVTATAPSALQLRTSL